MHAVVCVCPSEGGQVNLNVFHAAARMNGSFERKKRLVDRIKRNRTEFVTGRGSGKRLVMAHAVKSAFKSRTGSFELGHL